MFWILFAFMNAISLIISNTLDFIRIVVSSTIYLLKIDAILLYSLFSGNIIGYILGWTSEIVKYNLLSILDILHWSLAILYNILTPASPTSTRIAEVAIPVASHGHSERNLYKDWQILSVGSMFIVLCLLIILRIVEKQKRLTAREKMKTVYFIDQDGNWNIGGSKKRLLP